MKFHNRKVMQAWRRLLGGGGCNIVNSWKVGLPMLVALAALAPAFPVGTACAAEPADTADSAGNQQTSAADAANADLLLFWEQKELYVETATRTAKPISQVAENMEVVTAKEIEEMNAHNVAEVLNQVPGVYVDFNGMDFGSASFTHIQGSANVGEDRHVTLLLDGVPMNFLAGGNFDPIAIPVQIIERIEIIKGPASSAWGSSLGGVINIITKNAGVNQIPNGAISGSYGTANSQDYNAQLSGKAGRVGYYLFGGRQESDGLRDDRYYHRNSFYGKVALSPVHNLDLTFSAGYSNPFLNGGNNPSPLRSSNNQTALSSLFLTGNFDLRLTSELSLKGSIYSLRQRLDNDSRFLTSNDLLRETNYDDQTLGGNLKLVYAGEIQTLVVGMDVSHGSMGERVAYGTFFQQAPINQPASTYMDPSLDKIGVFANDTVNIGKFALTPGLRVDHSNVSGTFVSPSFGATYELSEHAIARVSVARGFTTPPLGYTAGGGFFLDPNPNLKYESVTSYQAGVESVVLDYLNLKGTLFRHDSSHEIVPIREAAPRQFFKMTINNGDTTRQGYELQMETAPVYNVSLKLAHSFVHITSDALTESKVNYSYQGGIKYDDRHSITAQLLGNYVWWDMDPGYQAQYKYPIFDFHLIKKFRICDASSLEAFLSVHNIFDSPYYTVAATPNPHTWVEGGMRVKF